MANFWFVLAFLPLITATLQNISACCHALSAAVGSSKVSYPSSAAYVESADSYFAQQEAQLDPTCVFKPTSAQDVSKGVEALAVLNYAGPLCPFAIKAGGHHTVIGIANIHDGVTIDVAGLDEISLSADRSVISLGTGNRWINVSETLDPMNLAVTGGRVSGIGVGGFLTGGGISYFSPSRGWACDNVKNFEIVLASGKIVDANASSNSDLFKALKGGGNNFGVVTRVDMETFQLGPYWGGGIYYAQSEVQPLISAFTNFTTAAADAKANVILSIGYAAQAGYYAFVDESYLGAVQNPPVYSEFVSIPQEFDTLRVDTLSDFTNELGENTPDGLRQDIISICFHPSSPFLSEVVAIWNSSTTSLVSGSSPVANFLYSLALQPLSASQFAASTAAGGNAMGLTASSGPLVLLDLTTQWTNSADDTRVLNATRSVISAIKKASQQQGLSSNFIYLNYASKEEDPIGGYGGASKAQLQGVSRKYDPRGLFQKAVPGGFKLFP
ncbi:MAG: hypothetical protein LQ340_003815 [Diploschistes diacapsis]|nr:MAG: hypothetical protein LQ340_003815 [Diploschistes diacapsis]